MRMTRADRDEWVAALKNPKNIQGKQYLHFINGNRESFCCLGLLCKLQAPRLNLKTEQRNAGFLLYGENRAGTLLPNEMQDKFQCIPQGFSIKFKNIPEKWKEKILEYADSRYFRMELVKIPYFSDESDVHITMINDAEVPFLEIANLIEKCVEVID